MRSILLALSLLAAASPAQSQDQPTEIRFHRVYLRNGNFIDGKLIADKPGEVILRMAPGEMAIRRDQIDRVELIRMRSYNDKPIILDKPKEKNPQVPVTNTAPPTTNTPEQVKRKVDMMILKVQATSGGEKEFNLLELQPLGDEGTAYLVSKAPNLDLKTLDAIAQAVINIKPGPKTNQVLEELLSNPVPSVRGLALTVLSVSGGDQAKLKYVRAQLTDANPRVRETALGLLGSVEDEDWFAPICDLCGDTDKEVRNRALRIARAIATKNSIQDRFVRVMTGYINHSDSGVRSDAVAMLGGLGQRDSWRYVTPLLDDSETSVRSQAAQTLMMLGVPESGEAIVAAMNREQDKWTRIYLAGAAQKMLLQKADAPLVTWLSDPDSEIKKLAEVTLKAIFAENFGSDASKWQTWLQGRPK